MAGYATTSETNYEGNALPILPIGIYDNVTFLGAKIEKPSKDDGTQLEERITFGFKTADGQSFNHSEIRPKDTDEKKQANLTKRVGHILSKFYPKEALVQGNTSWEGYANWVVGMANGANKGIKVKFLIVGNVYDGKARTGLPGYPPFIKKAGEELNFDANHQKANAEYEAFKNVQPDAPASTGGYATGTPNASTVGEF